ncbi:MAG: hypothetical protein GY753_09840 [Gammaproteobacteria bacterium]|nr:hypothetical protein [Gammaproteobacteria bacterium]
MTVAITSPVAGPFDGNDVTTVFPFTFKVADDDELLVVFTSTLDVESEYTKDSDFSISLNADQNASPGGSVTLLGGALATDTKLTLVRDTQAVQEVDLTNQGAWLPEIMEEALDRSIMRLQELTDEMALTFRVNVSSSLDPDDVVEDLLDASDAAVVAQAAAEAAQVAAEAAETNAETAETNAEAAESAAQTAETNAAASAVTAQVHEISWVTAGWVTATGYTASSPRQALSHGTKASSYVCILDHTSGSTTEPGVGASWATYWELLAECGADGADGADGSDGADGADGAGAGDVIGPASAADSQLAAFDTTTGKLIKDSGIPVANADAAYTHSQTAHAPTNADNTAANETSHTNVAKTDVDQDWSAPQRAESDLTDTDASYAIATDQDFYTAITGGVTISFTGMAAGRRGMILFNNTNGSTVAKNSYVKCDGDFLTTLSDAGIYLVSYFTKDATNVYVSCSQALS